MNINLLKVNKIPPITSITNFKVNLKDRKLEKNLRLNYTENSILFDFHGICLTNPTKVKYKVMLEGADMDWQPITNRTFANYPALSHGEYTFKVLAANNEGVWNEEPTSFSFYIKPPFWKTWWFYSLLVIAIISGIVVYIRIREKRLKMEKAILEQKVKQRTQLIREQNKELNVKNKNITDSINYARRIQRAMMPDQKLIENLGKSSFVFYRPKDIVSGDFFWYSEKDNYKIVVAADCTGHGVPGAFMSMISISALNSIVNEKGITEPGKILDSLRSQIIKDLKQSSGTEETQTKDGLDISLMVIDEENQKISFSGAYNSLYIIKNNAESFEDLSEVKADRMPIGLSAKMDQNFTTHHLNIDTGDRFYIGTDGYIDQFGGPKGKKFMSKRFKKLIFNLDRENSDNSIQELDSEFAKWKGKEEQIDDVLVIGIRY
jgi:serine phosphatase RsbU (regulator of sigma subunit)